MILIPGVTSAVLCALCGYLFSWFFTAEVAEVRREYRHTTQNYIELVLNISL